MDTINDLTEEQLLFAEFACMVERFRKEHQSIEEHLKKGILFQINPHNPDQILWYRSEDI